MNISNLNQLFGMPLFMFAALLPLTLATVFLLKAMRIESRGLLALSAMGLLLSAIASQLIFALFYLASPMFSDHIEPTTAVVGWLYAQGGQIYHAIDAPERYAFLYGPVSYIATGWAYEIFGTSILSAKLPGFVCLLIAMLALGAATRRMEPRHVYPLFVALGYMALLSLFFRNNSFWSKPDPFMVAAVAIGLYACTLQTGRSAWLLCAVALGIAVNAKVTGAVYFLPLLAWFLMRDGFRSIVVIGIGSAVLALLPFVITGQISLPQYVAWLQSAGGHGISRQLLLQNTFYLLFALLPAGFFMLWQQAVPGFRNLLVQHKLVSLAALIAALLIVIAASKPGSGPHHLLPFFPMLAFITAHAVTRVRAYRPATGWTTYGFWAPVAAVLLAATIKSGIAFYYGIDFVSRQQQGQKIVADLEAILEAYPDRHIYMGYGSNSQYPTTFLRTQLAYADQPYLVDAAAIMDFQASGLNIPQATISALLNDTTSIWLIPKGDEPFSLIGWYYRDDSRPVFDSQFREAFSKEFKIESSSNFFDLYAQPARGAK